MSRIYFTPIGNCNYVINGQADMLYDLLTFSLPWTFCSDIMEDDNRSKKLLDYFTLGDSTQRGTAQCYFTSESPEKLD